MSQTSAADRSAFVEGLRSERDAFREFCDVLQSERACLLRADVEALVQVTQQKSERVDRLVDLGSARTRYLESLGLDPGSTGSERWLSTHAGAEAARLSELWKELVESARQARDLNHANGTLITARLTHNQAALSALHTAARAQSLYGPDGQTNILSGHRELGQA